MHRSAFLLSALVAVLGAAVATVLASGRASFLVFCGTVALWMFALLPGIVALVVLLVVRRRFDRRRPLLEKLAGVLAGFLLLVVLLGPANIAGGRLADWRVDRAKTKSLATVAALEDYRERFGRYPEDLAEAGAAGVAVPVPGLVPESDYYATHDAGETFELYLPDHTAFLFGEWIYYSDDGKWFYLD